MTTKLFVNERGYRIGESHHNAKLTDSQVDLAFCMKETGLGYGAIAKLMGVSKSTMRDILTLKNRWQKPTKIIIR
jgi:hypothetical protein